MILACLGLGSISARAAMVERQTAEGPLSFEMVGGGAPASENDWAAMTLAGYVYEPGRLALGWQFGFTAKVSDITKVEVWDISQSPAKQLVSQDQIKLEDNQWHIKTDLTDITFKSEPWLTNKKPTERIFKIALTNSKGETRTLYQLAVFGKEMKATTVQLMKGNYIRVISEKPAAERNH